MKKLQKRITIAVLIIGLTITSFLWMPSITDKREGLAASQNETVAESYPNLDSDLIGENYTIRDYAASEKKIGTLDETITKIVPADYFSTVGAHWAFGKEYGYFISTADTGKGYKSTVLVIDIEVNKMGKPENILTYSYAPILGGEYTRGKNTTEVHWWDTSPISIYDPSMLTQIQSEYGYNSGEDGYVKAEDTTPILVGSRFNFNGAKRKVSGDWEFIADQSISCLLGAIPGVGDFLSELYSYTKDIYSASTSIRIEDKTVTGADEKYIIDFPARNLQDQLDSYYRTVDMKTTDSSILYHSSGGRFFSYTYILDSTAEPIRVTNGLSFSLKFTNAIYESLPDGVPEVFHITDERIFYDRTDELQASQTSSLLSRGEKRYTYTPNNSGNCDFTADSDKPVVLQVLDAQNNVVASGEQEVHCVLEANHEYVISVSSASPDVEGNRFTLNFFNRGYELIPEQTVAPVLDASCHDARYSFDAGAAANYSLEFTDADLCDVTVTDEAGDVLYAGRAPQSADFIAPKGKVFVDLHNYSDATLGVGMRLKTGTEATVNGETELLLPSARFGCLGFTAPRAGLYTIDAQGEPIELYDADLTQVVSKDGAYECESGQYFIKVSNETAAPKTVTVAVEFMPRVIAHGETTVAVKAGTEYFRLAVPLSGQYRIAASAGAITELIDRDFLPAPAQNGVYDLAAGVYYLGLSSNGAATAKIACEIVASKLSPNSSAIQSADEFGNAYYKLSVNLPAEYVFDRAVDVFGDALTPIKTLESGVAGFFAAGDYYIRVSGHGALTLNMQLKAVEVYLFQPVLAQSENYYLFAPAKTERYRMFTRGDLNNGLCSRIALYDSALNLIYDGTQGKYVETTQSLTAGQIYFIFCDVQATNGESLLFGIEYESAALNGQSTVDYRLTQEIKTTQLSGVVTGLYQFIPDASGTYYLYIEKRPEDTVRVNLDDARELTRDSGFAGDRVSRYTVTFGAAAVHHFVVTRTSGSAFDLVIVNTAVYSNLTMLCKNTDGTAVTDYVNFSVYEVGLNRGATRVPAAVTLADNEDRAILDNNTIYLIKSITGSPIVVAAEYFYQTYSITIGENARSPVEFSESLDTKMTIEPLPDESEENYNLFYHLNLTTLLASGFTLSNRIVVTCDYGTTQNSESYSSTGKAVAIDVTQFYSAKKIGIVSTVTLSRTVKGIVRQYVLSPHTKTITINATSVMRTTSLNDEISVCDETLTSTFPSSARTVTVGANVKLLVLKGKIADGKPMLIPNLGFRIATRSTPLILVLDQFLFVAGSNDSLDCTDDLVIRVIGTCQVSANTDLTRAVGGHAITARNLAIVSNSYPDQPSSDDVLTVYGGNAKESYNGGNGVFAPNSVFLNCYLDVYGGNGGSPTASSQRGGDGGYGIVCNKLTVFNGNHVDLHSGQGGNGSRGADSATNHGGNGGNGGDSPDCGEYSILSGVYNAHYENGGRGGDGGNYIGSKTTMNGGNGGRGGHGGIHGGNGGNGGNGSENGQNGTGGNGGDGGNGLLQEADYYYGNGGTGGNGGNGNYGGHGGYGGYGEAGGSGGNGGDGYKSAAGRGGHGGFGDLKGGVGGAGGVGFPGGHGGEGGDSIYGEGGRGGRGGDGWDGFDNPNKSAGGDGGNGGIGGKNMSNERAMPGNGGHGGDGGNPGSNGSGCNGGRGGDGYLGGNGGNGSRAYTWFNSGGNGGDGGDAYGGTAGVGGTGGSKADVGGKNGSKGKNGTEYAMSEYKG